ncbi:hypothetical protein EW146_g6505 [Bondarzewia mesenterica]|uniref:FAD/NAD(P)-binding domain-containing protein n=1 Tax=Bondarzewia mesenterica TaxID=1095465 RepID=A0A4S4LQF0_9AGAM|nr:hypothetical protein EW146_g6505 [Bondarzewia mesenterica]
MMICELPARPSELPVLSSPTSFESDTPIESISSSWLQNLSSVLLSQHFDQLDDLILPTAIWKDILSLTWDFRSIRTLTSIRTLLSTRAALHNFSVRALTPEEHLQTHGLFKPVLSHPFPDASPWIQFGFALETSVGRGTGVARLVPAGADGAWLAWTVFTSLDVLKDFPEKVGPTRFEGPDFDWVRRRASENEFVDSQPTVVVIGGGHIGLQVAARLKYLDVSVLVLEKAPRVGDSWRNRVQSTRVSSVRAPIRVDFWPACRLILDINDSKSFPATWPKYPPGKKIAAWLESYAENLDLNVWTSASISHIAWDAHGKNWTVDLTRGDGTRRTLTPKYVVFAHGSGGGVPNMPHVEGREHFAGKVLHSEEFKSGRDFQGQRAIVIGACNSAHDVAHDLYRYGADVTMQAGSCALYTCLFSPHVLMCLVRFQRSSTYVLSAKALASQLSAAHYVENGPPTDVVDRLNASTPHFIARLIQARTAAHLAETTDKLLHDKLRKAGFGLTMGVENAGLSSLLTTRRGGYYMNVGTSELIVDGRIKLKHGSEISRFTRTGLVFGDGTILDAAVVIFATGYGDARNLAHELCGPEVADKLGDTWGIDEEGELHGAWRDSGHPQLFFAQGNFAIARQYSSHLALQIKAMEEGLMNGRYTIEQQYRQE